MGRIVVLGCGYVGRVLARRLIAKGLPVRATTTTDGKLDTLAELGAEPALVDPKNPDTYAAALRDATAVVHLAPPGDRPIDEDTKALAAACGEDLGVYLYGSTTGAFGKTGNDWVDETTPSRDVGERGQRRLAYERGLLEAGLPVRTVRVAGIYGPGRTMRQMIERDAMILFEGGPPTSRIHVEDLARLLEAMLEPNAPPLAIACDEEPAPTLEVARYVCALLGREPPEPIAIEDAKRVLSPAAVEMRLGGRRCRSLVREALIGALTYPTYREGMRASLIDEGVALT